eukprot:GHVR01051906.1.p1 GENE.GHVR01051906.1~~GHVR01051906.1.p1  ORF type:complete len:125 (-),score=4.92 GHVR01051906.1:4675-5049(-)
MNFMERICECKIVFNLGGKIDRIKDASFANSPAILLENALKRVQGGINMIGETEINIVGIDTKEGIGTSEMTGKISIMVTARNGQGGMTNLLVDPNNAKESVDIQDLVLTQAAMNAIEYQKVLE